jgi:hypothetical protein
MRIGFTAVVSDVYIMILRPLVSNVNTKRRLAFRSAGWTRGFRGWSSSPWRPDDRDVQKPPRSIHAP